MVEVIWSVFIGFGGVVVLCSCSIVICDWVVELVVDIVFYVQVELVIVVVIDECC